jgi:hypothetical protein
VFLNQPGKGTILNAYIWKFQNSRNQKSLLYIVFSWPERIKWAFLISAVSGLFVCLSFLLLQNHCANFNQACHKSSLGGGNIEVCSNEGQCPSPREDNSKRVEIILMIFKNPFLKNQFHSNLLQIFLMWRIWS